LTVSTALAGAGSLSNRATGVLNIGGTSAITTLTATAAGNTVNYTGTGQAVKATSYGNLIFSGSGAKTMATGTSVGGNLSIAPTGAATASVGAGLNLNVGSLALGGLGRVNGTWGSTTATSATYQNNTYFAPTTGYLTILDYIFDRAQRWDPEGVGNLHPHGRHQLHDGVRLGERDSEQGDADGDAGGEQLASDL
jgi:hypothetical protein